MTDRDRLKNKIDYLQKVFMEDDDYDHLSEFLADRLLADKDIIVPPCKVGQKIWHLWEHYDGSCEIREGKVSMLQQKADKSWKFRISINSSVWDNKIDDIGKTVFLTKEEAETELRKRSEDNA